MLGSAPKVVEHQKKFCLAIYLSMDLEAVPSLIRGTCGNSAMSHHLAQVYVSMVVPSQRNGGFHTITANVSCWLPSGRLPYRGILLSWPGNDVDQTVVPPRPRHNGKTRQIFGSQ